MSYNLAVWAGSRPVSDAEAAAVFEQLLDLYQGIQPAIPPSPAIATYVHALLARWPDITAEGGEDSPWSDGPMMGNAAGPILYFGMVFSMVEEAATFAADLAEQHGLVCFDPQSMNLWPSSQSSPRDIADERTTARRRRWWRRDS